MTQQEYFENSSNWGNYQYVTLPEVVNGFMGSLEDDDYVAGVDRLRVINLAKRGIRQELYPDVVNEIKARELEISPSLTITLPDDYVNYVRISWVDGRGYLHPMAENNMINVATAYLQDNNYNLLFDDEGEVLEASGQRPEAGDRSFYQYEFNRSAGNEYERSYHHYHSPDFNVDLSKIYKNGAYRIDKEGGYIQFSSDVNGKNIVLEYLTDGLSGVTDGEIRVHKFCQDALDNYIYWKLIERRRFVPNTEKDRARREYFESKRKAKLKIKPIRKSELIQVLKGQNKFIKG